MQFIYANENLMLSHQYRKAKKQCCTVVAFNTLKLEYPILIFLTKSHIHQLIIQIQQSRCFTYLKFIFIRIKFSHQND